MPHATRHEPPSHPPHPAIDDIAPATNAAAYRARIPGVEPDAVLRNIRRCNGFRSWSLAPRETYQLADTTLTMYEHHERAPELILDGPDEAQIRSLLARLGFDHDRVTVHAIPPADEDSA